MDKYAAQVFNYDNSKADCCWGNQWHGTGYAFWVAIGT